jgi:hypothetical protein
MSASASVSRPLILATTHYVACPQKSIPKINSVLRVDCLPKGWQVTRAAFRSNSRQVYYSSTQRKECVKSASTWAHAFAAYTNIHPTQ